MNKPVIIFTLFILLLSVLDLEATKIILGNQLREDQLAIDKIKSIFNEIDQVESKKNPDPHPAWNKETETKLKSFITIFPNTTSALTAKLIIGIINSHRWYLAKYNFANEIFNEIISQHPSSWQAYASKYLLAFTNIQENKWNESIDALLNAIPDLEKLRTITNPEYLWLNTELNEGKFADLLPLAHYDLAMCYLKLSQIDKAKVEYQKIISDFPGFPYMHHVKSDVEELEKGQNPYSEPRKREFSRVREK